MNNEELVTRAQGGQNVNECLMSLYEQNKGFIYNFIQRYAGYMELEDLWQEAFIALCDAVSSYKPDSGAFITWLGKILKYHINRVIGDNGASIPNNLRLELIQYRRFREYYYSTFGRYPSDAIVRRSLEITPAQLKRIKAAEASTSCVSIYEPIGDELTIADTLQDDSISPIDEMIDSEIDSQVLRDRIAELEQTQRDIIDMYFFKGLTNKQISEMLDTTESRARDIRIRALRKLKDRLTELHLFEERTYSGIYRGTYNRYKYTQTSVPESIALKMLEDIHTT